MAGPIVHNPMGLAGLPSLGAIGVGASLFNFATRGDSNPDFSLRRILSGDVGGISQSRAELQRQEELQREFARHGVRWRVEDAKAAGVHPLFALGGGGAAYAPAAIVGQAAGAARGRSQAEFLQALTSLQALEASVAKDHAQADYYRALAAKARQEKVSAPSFPEDVVKVNPVDPFGQFSGLVGHPLYADAVKLEPDPMTSRSGFYEGQTAGRAHPSMREFRMPNGDLLYLPATQGGGIPEEIDITLLPEIIGANIHRYGAAEAVLGAIMRWFGGKYRRGMFSTPGYRRWEEENRPRNVRP